MKIVKNINEDSSNQYMMDKESQSLLASIIDGMIANSIIIQDLIKKLYKQDASIMDCEDLYESIKDWSTHPSVMFLANIYEGSKIAPKNEAREAENDKIMDQIKRALALMKEKGIVE
ncbi:hypothetical protein A0256_23300 [Mucilaginibacter sp. PAMC 26640]|nr:hypothetical protein A0256_23300 [Mucilaginibacter sp. PAMC 26640]